MPKNRLAEEDASELRVLMAFLKRPGIKLGTSRQALNIQISTAPTVSIYFYLSAFFSGGPSKSSRGMLNV